MSSFKPFPVVRALTWRDVKVWKTIPASERCGDCENAAALVPTCLRGRPNNSRNP